MAFVSPTHVERYDRFVGSPSQAKLARFFYLDDVDLSFVTTRRGEHTRLGLALQLTTVRYLGTFLNDPTDVPLSVLQYVTQQLGFTNVPDLQAYRTSSTHWQHAAEISRVYGYTPYGQGFIKK